MVGMMCVARLIASVLELKWRTEIRLLVRENVRRATKVGSDIALLPPLDSS